MTVAHSFSKPLLDFSGAYRFTVEQYHRLIDAGILPEDSSYELLDGIVLRRGDWASDEDSMGHKPAHALVVTLLSMLIARVNDSRRHLRIQLPIILNDLNAPEPDGSIVRGSPRDYAQRLPRGEDVFCVIEAAETSLERDQGDKAVVYASAGIPQYLLINLQRGIIENYSQPDRSTGQYLTRAICTKGQSVLINLGDGQTLTVDVNDLLP